MSDSEDDSKSNATLRAFNMKKPALWPRYMQVWKFAFKREKVTQPDEQRAFFMMYCGINLVDLAAKLCMPKDLEEMVLFSADANVDTIWSRLTLHFAPVVNPVTAYVKFYHLHQKAGQKVAEYVAELREQAKECNFEKIQAPDYVDTMVLYQMVCGLRDSNLQHRLLEKAKLTLKDALECAAAAEAACSDIVVVRNGQGKSNMFMCDETESGSSGNADAFALQYGQKGRSGGQQRPAQQQPPRQGSTKPVACFRCAGPHFANDCSFNPGDLYCTGCKQEGHLRPACGLGNRMRKARKSAPGDHRDRATGRPGQASGGAHPGGASGGGGKQGGHSQKQRSGDGSYALTVTQPNEQQSAAGASFHGRPAAATPLGLHDLFQLQEDEDADLATATGTSRGRSPPIPPASMLNLKLDGKAVTMMVDNGSGISTITWDLFQRLWPGEQLLAADIMVNSYSMSCAIDIRGIKMVTVRHGTKVIPDLPLYVVDRSRNVNLLGRQWFPFLGISVRGQGVYAVDVVNPSSLDTTRDLRLHPALLHREGDQGRFVGPPISLDVDPEATPKFCKPRPVPFALQPGYVAELGRLQRLGVIRPIRFSKHGTPVVPVRRKDGSVRLCADYSCTVNKIIRPDKYKLPTCKEALSKLAGGKVFSKLDFKDAYMQMPVDDKTAELLTVNTIQGLFTVHALQFGLTDGPARFQRAMDMTFCGVQGLANMLDDFVVSGATQEEHDARLKQVLDIVEETGLRLNVSKCTLSVPSVEFLGHRVDAEGIHPLEDKVKAILEAPMPQNVKQLQAFLGLINFYDHFIDKKASHFFPLYKLLEKGAKWEWGPLQENAVKVVRAILTSSTTLAHYDGSRPLSLACDASPYGVSAVLSQEDEDGVERPVAFASRTLSKAERNYSQTDREACAIIFGLKKYHQYLYGRTNIKIFTDHKPLLGIFQSGQPTPEHLSQRMIRWSLFIRAYSYTLCYRPGESNGNADMLSRLPLPEDPRFESDEEVVGIHLLDLGDEGPVRAAEVAEETAKDEVLMEVMELVKNGWPGKVPKAHLTPFHSIHNSLSVQGGCLLYGDRVVVPGTLRRRVLEAVHASHHGLKTTLSVARAYVWWPNMVRDVKTATAACTACISVRHDPPKSYTPWPTPTEPWERVHLDYAGPVEGQVFLILVDAFTKWSVIWPVKTQTANELIRCFREAIAAYGVPKLVVSDNGRAFTSVAFTAFLERNGIKFLTSSPFHPESNGQAEREVQTFKEQFRRHQGDVETRVARSLFAMRTRVHATTGVSPAELMFGRKLRTPLDCMAPSHRLQLQETDEPHNTRKFTPGDLVHYRRYKSLKKKSFVPGVIVEKCGRKLFQVKDESDGEIHKRHVNQIISRVVGLDKQRQRKEDDDNPVESKVQSQILCPRVDISNALPTGATPDCDTEQPRDEQPVLLPKANPTPTVDQPEGPSHSNGPELKQGKGRAKSRRSFGPEEEVKPGQRNRKQTDFYQAPRR